jgi:hypothetical protein
MTDSTSVKRPDIQKQKIRILVSGMYDLQKLRIATGNRVVQSFNIQMGQEPSTKQEDMEKETQKMIEKLRKEYKLITDAYIDKQYAEIITDGDTKDKRKANTTKGNPKGKTTILEKSVSKNEDGSVTNKRVVKLAKNASVNSVIKAMTANKNSEINLIKSELDYDLMSTYMDLCDEEEKNNKILAKEVAKHPMWDLFFKDVKGCGPLMAAVCLAYFDIDVARHVSSFWKYAGLDTVDVVKEDGTVVNEGRSRKHTVEQTYIDKDGKEQTKRGLGYNPVLKTKLVGVLGSCLLKAGLRSIKDDKGNPVLDENGNKQYMTSSKYAQCYVDYLHRLNNRADKDTLTDAHKHSMANRYMIKMFIRDLWVTWREHEGYEVSEPYEVAKLGYKPHKYNEYHERVAKDTQSKRAV